MTLPFHQTRIKSIIKRRQRKPEYFTYSFKHFECLQLHCFCFLGVASLISKPGLGLDFGDSGFPTLTEAEGGSGKTTGDCGGIPPKPVKSSCLASFLAGTSDGKSAFATTSLGTTFLGAQSLP
ncbi:hypothetical protein V8G54_004326, partial [Vigna mungo]